MKPYLTREYAISNDVFDPTPWEEEIGDDYVIARCPLCDKPIYYGDTDVHIIDGMDDMPICDNCWNWKKLTARDLMERLFKEAYVVSGKKYSEEY